MWVDYEPDVQSLANIGVEDRNFILALGSAVVFLVPFGFSLLVMYCCYPFRNKRRFKGVYGFFHIEGYIRIIWIRFLLETYIDLFLAGLVNCENLYLFNVASNWGFGGNLSLSD